MPTDCSANCPARSPLRPPPLDMSILKQYRDERIRRTNEHPFRYGKAWHRRRDAVNEEGRRPKTPPSLPPLPKEISRVIDTECIEGVDWVIDHTCIIGDRIHFAGPRYVPRNLDR